MKRQKLKILCITSVVIFNLLICFMATFAWFTAARNLSGDQMGIQIEARELSLTYNLYKFNDNTKQIEEIDSFDLNSYDSIIKQKNEHTPLVIKTALSGNIFDNIDNIDVAIQLACNEANSNTEYLSNIIHFKFKSFVINSNDPTTIYNTALITLESEQVYKFVTTVKNTQIDLTLNQASVSNNIVYVYGVVDYDEVLIDNMTIDINNVPTFQNDLEYIRYSVHE